MVDKITPYIVVSQEENALFLHF